MNTAWAIALVDRLAASGVRHAVLCPGSRSTPLTLAMDAHPDIACVVHQDERGAAFHALGIGQATGRPAVVVTTSGTAVANLLPACIEAHQANVPLLLLSADRPARLRGTGANQTMDQPGLFTGRVRFEADLPEPGPDHGPMLATVEKAVAACTQWPPGPAHLNQPFDAPLEPDHHGQELLQALRRQRPRNPPGPVSSAPDGDLPGIEPRMLGARGLIVCGPRTPAHLAPRIHRLMERIGAIVLADGLSAMRFTDTVLDAYDQYLDHPDVARALRPDWVLQLGATPTSKALRGFLQRHGDVPRYKVDASGRRWDDIGGDVMILDCDPARLLDAWARPDEAGKEAAGMHDARSWRAAWYAVEHHAHQVAGEAILETPDMEAAWVPAVVADGRDIFIGNSMPVRDLDRFGHGIDGQTVYHNRGVSGIDGTLATAAGIARVRPLIAVIGDVAFLHDINSLRLIPPALQLVVIDNGGGRIFHHLPVSQATDHFDDLFVTPPGLDIQAACAAFGRHATLVAASGLADALASDEPGIIVVRSKGQESARWRQHLQRRVHKDLPQILAAALDAQAS